MRFIAASIGLVLVSTVLVGCGQSGNLQLVNSPDYDNRAKYLLHSNDDNKPAETQQKVKVQHDAPDQTVPASQVISN